MIRVRTKKIITQDIKVGNHKAKDSITDHIFVLFSIEVITVKIKSTICLICKYYKGEKWIFLIIYSELSMQRSLK